MAKRKRRDDHHDLESPYARDGVDKLIARAYHHVAEIYGEGEAQRLRPWARQRVRAHIGNEG